MSDWVWAGPGAENTAESLDFCKKAARVRRGGKSGWGATKEQRKERREAKAKERREDRIRLLVRIADDRLPGYAKLVKVAETEDFKDWFYDINGWDLGDDLYKDPDDTIRFIQRTYELEDVRRQPVIRRTNEDFVLYVKRRRERVRQATPGWWDCSKYKELKDLRAAMNERHPNKAPYHIDHIIPLRGDLVCGLHVHTNMRVIPGRENCVKSNSFEIE